VGLRGGFRGVFCEGLCGFWTNSTHKTRKETGMNLESIEDKIEESVSYPLHSVRDSVRNSISNSMWSSNWYSVWNSVGGSVNIGLKGSIRKERKRG
jgi:hypothetical protein